MFFEKIRDQINIQMKQIIEANALNKKLTQALEYSALAPGKRIRPAFVYATGELFNLSHEILDPIACAIEFIHCYSLIHDDLPAMDNDSLRRGQPTCHVQFDEATAILAGDALQALAMQTLAELPISQISFEKYQRCLVTFSQAIGAKGLVAGQMFDIENENKNASLEEIENTHRLKTGSLIAAAIMLPAILSNCSNAEFKALNHLSDTLGIAFQIQDDILDAEQSTEQLGKTANKDAAQHKSTYVKLLGITGAKEKLLSHLNSAKTSLAIFPEDRKKHLEELIKYNIERTH
jgi:geranylgeranyl pyrophosphate synthase